MDGDQILESIVIAAEPAAVFEHFTNPDAMVRWMGEYAVLDPRPGGKFAVDIGGVPVRGEYIEVDPPHRLVISWGHAGSDRLPPGVSRVEINITPEKEGSKIEIIHTGLPLSERDGFMAGWKHYSARLGVAAAGGDPGLDPGM